MTGDKPSLPWPGEDERIVVEEMIRDGMSEHWYECREFVKKRVQAKAKNIPVDQRDDIVQEVMMRVGKSLLTFQFRCRLRTWLFEIVHTCIVDAYRRVARTARLETALADPHDENEQSNDASIATTAMTAEDVCIFHNNYKKVVETLEEYVSTHANPARNRRILSMVLFEERSLEEAAKAAECSSAVAGYIVRSAKRYVREKLGHWL